MKAHPWPGLEFYWHRTGYNAGIIISTLAMEGWVRSIVTFKGTFVREHTHAGVSARRLHEAVVLAYEEGLYRNQKSEQFGQQIKQILTKRD